MILKIKCDNHELKNQELFLFLKLSHNFMSCVPDLELIHEEHEPAHWVIQIVHDVHWVKLFLSVHKEVKLPVTGYSLSFCSLSHDLVSHWITGNIDLTVII